MKLSIASVSLATLLVGCASAPPKYVLNPANANNFALVQLAVNTKYHKWIFPFKPAEYMDVAIWDYSKIADGSACQKKKSLFGTYSQFDESKALKGMLNLKKTTILARL